MLAGHFGIKKTRILIIQKYYWPMLWQDIEVNVKGYNICLTSKAVRHSSNNNLQLLLILIYRWKDLFMNFVTHLLVSTNWKSESYDSILVIIDCLIKIIYYKFVKVLIDISDLAKVIINVVIHYHNICESIVTD